MMTRCLRKGFGFTPLKVVAHVLGGILQVGTFVSQLTGLDSGTEKRSEGDFEFYLKRIEFRASRVIENPNFDLNSPFTRSPVEQTSADLMIVAITFLNSALVYFSRVSFVILNPFLTLTVENVYCHAL